MLPIEGIDENEFKNTGLNDSQVEESLKKYGINKIEPKKKISNIARFFKQLADPMVILLIVVGFISVILTILNGIGVGRSEPLHGIELASGIVEPIIIFGIVFANAGFGMWQEGKANKEMEALQNLTSPHAKVIRNSELQIIDSKDIVVGDLLYLEAGDQISADAKLIESFNLEVNESILTGESLLVKKDVNETNETERIIEQKNMIFSGTSVINGSAKAIVTSIGSKTEMGQITELIKKESDNLTPFQKQLQKLSKYLGYFAIAISILTFFVNIVLMSDGAFNIGLYWQQSLEVSIALSIAAVPESMLAVIMVILATAVRRMSLKKALIKRLPSVETLGSTSIICSDKTGTLTQNKMTVVEMWNKDLIETTNDKSKNLELLKFGTLCTNANVSYDENNDIELVGDPTETSIIQALLDLGINKQELNKKYKRLLEIPFDSVRKMMTIVVEDKETKQKIAITKGAPDSIFNICSASNKEIINNAETHNIKMSSDALRVLAVSYKYIDNIPNDLSTLESDQSLIGLLGIIDPPREEVKASIAECLRAGIRPIMITGDYKNTAVAIANKLGIMLPGTSALSGSELALMSDEDLAKNIEKYSVYARVSPQDKIRIVKAWQADNKIVSMTGDGVNDAPSLKAADIGCAMGITGTDVSKEAADLILTDDNFSTIVEAVKEGRKVMNNIKNVLVLLLATCFSTLFTIFFGMIIFGGNYFSSIQILWCNVISETIPAITLGLNVSNDDVMRFKPRNKNENIINLKLLGKIILIVIFTTILSLLAYYIGISCAMQSDHLNYYYDSLSGTDKTKLLELSINYEHYIDPQTIKSNAWNLSYIREAIGYWSPNIFKGLIYSGSALSFITLTTCLGSNVISLRSNKSIFKESIKNQQYAIYSFLGSYATIAFIAYVPYVNYTFSMNTYSYNNLTINYGNNSWINIYPYLSVFVILFIHEISKIIQNKLIAKKQLTQESNLVINIKN